MGYIRVRDFARDNNCTVQNIYKHMRKYTEELNGHVKVGPGKQGQLLDDEAQEFLRSVMYPKSITVDNETMAAELNELRAALMKLGQENLKLAAQLAKTEGERDRALLDAGQYQKLLQASQEAEEAKNQELEETKRKVMEAELAAREIDQMLGKVQAERDSAEAQIRALKGRNLWERLTRKGE